MDAVKLQAPASWTPLKCCFAGVSQGLWQPFYKIMLTVSLSQSKQLVPDPADHSTSSERLQQCDITYKLYLSPGVSDLPAELKRCFLLIRELDQKSTTLQTDIDQRCRNGVAEHRAEYQVLLHDDSHSLITTFVTAMSLMLLSVLKCMNYINTSTMAWQQFCRIVHACALFCPQ